MESRLREIYNELSSQFNFKCPVHVEIVISERLRSCNGNCRLKVDRLTREIKKVKITMSKALFDEFGWERFEQTFRHEVAHLANKILYNGKQHDYTFKMLCKKFGGSMNPSMSKGAFADCYSKEFVKVIVKWKYVCPCGVVDEKARRMNRKIRFSHNHRCIKCKTPVAKWKEIQVA